jgi:serine/threonine-protein kinase HipA
MNETTAKRELANSDPTLRVFLNDTPVGRLSLLPGDISVFAFDDAYADNPERPTLSLSFKSATGQLLRDVKTRRTKIDPFFSNLLPEGHMREYLARRAGVDKEREFFLLSALKDDLPGAIRLEANIPLDQSQYQENAGGSEHDDGSLRFSLAGVQLKVSALREAKKGLTIPVSGAGGDWIVKLPSSAFDALPEAEFSMMTLAGLSGIDVPQVVLTETAEVGGLPPDLPPSFGPSLAIERYDRKPGGRRIHAEDFAQVFGLSPADKYGKASYENIAYVLWTETGEEGLTEFVSRLVFTVLIGNADMHVKNCSLIYPDGRHPKLSPAYDLVPTILFMPSDINLGLSFGKTKNMHSINSDVLRKFAAGARVPEAMVMKTARQVVNSTLEAWSAHKAELPLSQRQIQAIEQHMDSVPLTKELSHTSVSVKTQTAFLPTVQQPLSE